MVCVHLTACYICSSFGSSLHPLIAKSVKSCLKSCFVSIRLDCVWVWWIFSSEWTIRNVFVPSINSEHIQMWNVCTFKFPKNWLIDLRSQNCSCNTFFGVILIVGEIQYTKEGHHHHHGWFHPSEIEMKMVWIDRASERAHFEFEFEQANRHYETNVVKLMTCNLFVSCYTRYFIY